MLLFIFYLFFVLFILFFIFISFIFILCIFLFYLFIYFLFICIWIIFELFIKTTFKLPYCSRSSSTFWNIWWLLYLHFSFMITSMNRSCHQRRSIKKSVLKSFAKFTGTQLYQSLFVSSWFPYVLKPKRV